MEQYDLTIIGAGPAGYVAAIRAAQLKMNVLCIEKDENLGGTCLNVGCIPSKNLLNASSKYKDIKNLSKYGINVTNVELDINKTIEAKNSVVKNLTSGISSLFLKNKVKHIKGVAKFTGKNSIQITLKDGSVKSIETKKTIIATGSSPRILNGFEFNGESIVDSTDALEFKSVPKTMGIIGAGVIGLELSSVWNNFGSKVTVFEYSEKLLSALDTDVSKHMQKTLNEQGINILFNQKNLQCTHVDSNKVKILSSVDGKEQEFEFEKLLISVGREPNTKGLNLENIGVNLHENGFIKVTEDFKTSVEDIYAVGDVIGGAMLAHKASEEAVTLVENLAGINAKLNYNLVPAVIYTSPEVATIGFTEQELKNSSVDYVVGKFPFLANSRAKAVLQENGFVKLVCHASSLQILGASIVGPCAGEMLQEVALAMSECLPVTKIAHLTHSHPSYSEAVKEAALAVVNQAIHI